MPAECWLSVETYCSCRADVALPHYEIRFENLTLEASVNVGMRALPNVVKAYWDFFEVLHYMSSLQLRLRRKEAESSRRYLIMHHAGDLANAAPMAW